MTKTVENLGIAVLVAALTVSSTDALASKDYQNRPIRCA